MTSSGCRPGGAAGSPSSWTPAWATATTAARGRSCSPPSGRSRGCPWSTSRRRSSRSSGCGSPRRSTRARRSPAATWPPRCGRRCPTAATAPLDGPGGTARRPPTTRRSPSCAGRSAGTPATAATTARTTPAGPSATTGCARETAQLEQRVESRTNTIARTFDRVCALLESLGLPRRRRGHRRRRAARPHLQRARPAGRRVRARRAVGRADAGRAGRVRVRAGVRVPADRRRGAAAAARRVASGRCSPRRCAPGDGWTGSRRTTAWRSCASPTSGFAWAAYRWASGGALEQVLGESGLPAGDFVRWAKQLVDLLGQVAQAAAVSDPGLRRDRRRRPSTPSAAASSRTPPSAEAVWSWRLPTVA